MCKHSPTLTGRRITAEFGKTNLPDGIKPVISTGEEAVCSKCGKLLIVHDQRYHYQEECTEIEPEQEK